MRMLRIVFSSILALASLQVFAQVGIQCVSAGPGEDASRQINISWATDTTVAVSYVLFTTKNDTQWKHCTKVSPSENRRCDLFAPLEGMYINKFGAELKGLNKDTDYKYVIETADGTRSSEHYFRTAGARNWSACVISDFHSHRSGKRLESGMKMIDKILEIDPSVDFIFSTGDVVGYSNGYSLWRDLFTQPAFEKYLWARVNGNHDNWTKNVPKEKRRDVPNYYYPATSFFPHNGYEGEMGVCYHFRYGNTFFVMLNSEDISKKNGELDAAREWTRKVIREAREGKNPPTFVVVSMHYHWFDGRNGESYQYADWADVFDEMGVDLALAGNNHIYVRSKPLYEGKVASQKQKGTIYLQTPCSDNERGREIQQDSLKNRDLLSFLWSEGKRTVGGVLMTVNGRKMTLTLYDRNGVVKDTCFIKAR